MVVFVVENSLSGTLPEKQKTLRYSFYKNIAIAVADKVLLRYCLDCFSKINVFLCDFIPGIMRL